MPEEAKGKEDAQQAIDVAAGGADKTKSVVMILIVLSVLVMVCTPVVTIFAMRAMISSAPTVSSDSKEKKVTEKYGECSIKAQQCIIGNSKGTRYVKLDVIIQYTEPDTMKGYFDEKGGEGSSSSVSIYNRIKAEITKIVMGKQLDELDSPAGLKNLSEEMKEAIKNLIPKGAKGTITEVYFPNFLIS